MLGSRDEFSMMDSRDRAELVAYEIVREAEEGGAHGLQ
jgi:hypothetical protein